ncbi:MAG: RNA polymerase sigma factor [Pirellulaceae bacterium]
MSHDDQPEPNRLVEHFFRHEYANLVSVLTRVFGFARIDLVEDMVGAAMLEAMNSWKQRGVPDNPAGWIHRVARNRILDSLRRERTHDKALAFTGLMGRQNEDAAAPEALFDQWLNERALPDSLLRMMFVCCHPTLDRKSQISLTLKILCGFSVGEIARGLLITPDAAKKRIQRAEQRLADADISIEFREPDQLQLRLSVVHDVLYLMFNEGYSTSHGIEPIRDDVCEEATRLCHMLCEHETLSTPESRALLALMLFHSSRLAARTDTLGNIVLLGDQDRSLWDRKLISVAERWLIRSIETTPSRFHFEAVIAQMHCSASSVEQTDWTNIVRFYDRLMESYPSPVYRLNRAIAIGESGDHELALSELAAIRQHSAMRDYYLLDCAAGHIRSSCGDIAGATDAWLAALSKPLADHQKQLIERRLKALVEQQREKE